MSGREDRLVLDGAHDRAHGAAAIPRRQGRAHDPQVVRLGPAGSEDDLIGLGAHGLGNLPARLFQTVPRGAAESMRKGHASLLRTLPLTTFTAS